MADPSDLVNSMRANSGNGPVNRDGVCKAFRLTKLGKSAEHKAYTLGLEDMQVSAPVLAKFARAHLNWDVSPGAIRLHRGGTCACRHGKPTGS